MMALISPLLVLLFLQSVFKLSSSWSIGTLHQSSSNNRVISGTAFNPSCFNNKIVGIKPRKQSYSPVCCFMARPNIHKLSSELQKIEAQEKKLLEEEAKKKLQLEQQEISSLEHFQEDDFIELFIPPEFDNVRVDLVLDSLLPQYLDTDDSFDTRTTTFSRAQVADLIKKQLVLLSDPNSNNKQILTRKSFKVSSGQTILLSRSGIFEQLYANHQPTASPENIPIHILYEDEYMIVVNKAAGMVVHPAAGNWNGTLVNALAYYLTYKSPFGPGELLNTSSSSRVEILDGITGENTVIPYRPGIVHRLDKGTTGVMVVAKTTAALEALSEMFALRKVKKTYIAITVGNPGSRVVIDNYIARHPKERQKMRVVPDPKQFASGRGRSVSTSGSEVATSLPISASMPYAQRGRRAISYVDTRAFDGKLGVAEVRIQTGRTHQIRVHLQDRGTPVYGDDSYGLADWNKKLSKQHNVHRPLLHAYQLELDHHPILRGENKVNMCFRAHMAADMALLANTIWPEGRKERPELFYQTPIVAQ